MLREQIRRELTDIVGDDYVLDRPEELIAYSYDAAPRHQAMPDAVVQPANTEEAAAVMKVCAEHRLPVITRGSGTNLSGGTVPVGGGVVIHLFRMNKIIEVDEENLTCTVEPGVLTGQVHRRVEERSLFYPPDPGSMHVSTIGGNIAQGSGGLRGLKYGVTKDYVLGLELVLASGDVLETGGKYVKDVAGYDLTRLIVGSGGTLAMVTRAILKLVPLPPARRTALALFDEMVDAGRAVSRIIAEGIIPSTLEFLDQGTLRAVERYARIGLPTDAKAVLLMEQDGRPETCAEDIDAMAAVCREEGAREVRVASTPEEGARLVEARRAALSALSSLSPTTILEDATVPRARVPHMVAAIEEIAAHYNVEICTFGHAGDGNLHPTCITDERDAAEMERVDAALDEIFHAALSFGGTITGEHGVGLSKAPYLGWQIPDAGLELMKGIKRAFDPHNILNPGKIFGAETRRRVVMRNGPPPV